MIFKLSDFNIPERIYKIYYNIKPLFENFAKEQLSFNKLFATELETEHDISSISKDSFTAFLWKKIKELGLNKELSIHDIVELVEFAD